MLNYQRVDTKALQSLFSASSLDQPGWRPPGVVVQFDISTMNTVKLVKWTNLGNVTNTLYNKEHLPFT